MEAEKENSNNQDKNELIQDLAPFFDLLAKFNHEDKLKEKAKTNTNPP